MKSRLILLFILSLNLLPSILQTSLAEDKAQPQLSNKDFIYTYDEMLDFDLENYLTENYPDLLDYLDTITHWSGYSSVSPKVLITLIVIQNSDNGIYTGIDPEDPFTSLSDKTGFAAQTEEISALLAKNYYTAKKSGSGMSADEALQVLLSRPSADAHSNLKQFSTQKNISDVRKFSTRLHQLFPEILQSPESLDPPANLQKAKTPPETLLQLPYPIGRSWFFGGTHSERKSSIDFAKRNVRGWGIEGTSDTRVSAAHGGTVVQQSSCSIEIISKDRQWSTSYYHLDNVRVRRGQTVSANDFIANYADNLEQALCEGGRSTGPHLHFSLKRNGERSTLDGVSLSGYKIHAGRDDYDIDPRYFWLEANGTRYYGFKQSLFNPGTETDDDHNDQSEDEEPQVSKVSAPVSPVNDQTIHTSTPTFTWTAIPGATHYAIHADSRGKQVIWNQVRSDQADCSSGTGRCSYSFSHHPFKKNEPARWRVRVDSPKRGALSNFASFNIKVSHKAMPVSPVNRQAIHTSTPTFTWTAIPGTTRYAIHALDSRGKQVLWNHVRSDQAGCSSGTGHCSYSFSHHPFRKNGLARWRVRVDSPRRGALSNFASFNIETSHKPVPVSPVSGQTIHTSTPTFTWTAIPGTTHYAIHALDSRGKQILWYRVRSDKAGCRSGRGRCSYSFSNYPFRRNGPARWRVRVNSPRRGALSNFASFNIERRR